MQIFECDAHNYHPKHYYIPSIELQAVWEQPAPGPDTLVEFINIVGVKRPKSLALQHEPGRPYPPETPGTNGNRNKSVQCALLQLIFCFMPECKQLRDRPGWHLFSVNMVKYRPN